MFKAYWRYLVNRKNAHGIHSPFVYDFYNYMLGLQKYRKTVLSPDELLLFNEIEEGRKEMRKSLKKIVVADYGAGSRSSSLGRERKISDITKNATIRKKYGMLMSRIASFYKCQRILELGTSLGIGTAYLSVPNSVKKVETIEGCKSTYEAAAAFWSTFSNHQKIHAINETFDNGLREKEGTLYDLIYIDGNHTYDATIAYFEKALLLAHNDTFIIFDDINWSEGMQKAWEEIKQSREVNVSIDLFQLGIVLKRKKQRKQNFILKF